MYEGNQIQLPDKVIDIMNTLDEQLEDIKRRQRRLDTITLVGYWVIGALAGAELVLLLLVLTQ